MFIRVRTRNQATQQQVFRKKGRVRVAPGGIAKEKIAKLMVGLHDIFQKIIIILDSLGVRGKPRSYFQ